MSIIVSKFGGSSTANAERFRRIDAIVRASSSRRCVVLSAPGVDDRHPEKVTAMLERCWQCRQDPAALERAVAGISRRYCEIARSLLLPDMDGLVRREIARGISASRQHTLSRGEYLCARLYSLWSGIPMADAAELVVFGPDGEPDEQRTRRRFEALAEGGGRVVVPGFYGADVNGRIQTFPRNGSDITGALAAEGMGAGLYENWSDVPGLMTADPAIVKDARLIPQVGYRQMRLIARSGAQVLHPSCLDPVASAGIPTRLRNTLCPDSFGTLVDEHVQRFAPCLVGKRRARLPGVDGGASEVSQISVFGVPEERVGKAAASLEPLLIEKGDCQTCVYVPKALYERTLQVLHQRLLSPDPS